MQYVDSAIENKEILTDPFFKEIKGTFYDSFVRSQGRQYVQMYDLLCIAEMWKEESFEIDWDILESPATTEAMSRMRLPRWHTPVPGEAEVDVPGQIPGIFKFWFLNFKHALDNRFHGEPLPTDEMLDEQMETCGVPLYETSSSTEEELAAMHKSFERFRDPATNQMDCDELIFHGLDLLIKGEMHWQTRQRPRQDNHDPFESRWYVRTLQAMQKPPKNRTTYDRLNIRTSQVLDIVLALPPEILQSDAHMQNVNKLYRRLIEKYNTNHPHDTTELLHKSRHQISHRL